MFQPPIFREERTEVMQAMMRKHPFATLISTMAGCPQADHLPLVLRDGGRGMGILEGHMAVANPLWRNAEAGIRVLAVFQGPQGYVTPSWYPSKAEHGRVVPTWNYVVVHARGTLQFCREPEWLMEHLTQLTAQHETGRELPWSVGDAPTEFIMRQLRGLVGFDIVIEELTGSWKVSQNRSDADRDGVVAGLEAQATSQAHALAELVRETER